MRDSTRNVIVVVVVLAVGGVALFAIRQRMVRERIAEPVETAVETAGAVARDAAAIVRGGNGFEEAGGDGSGDASQERDGRRGSLFDVDILGELDRTAGEVLNEVEKQALPPLTLADREAIGREVHAAIVSEATVVRDPAIIGRVRRLGLDVADRAAAREDFSNLSYTFTVLESPVPNAFAHVGGYVYVNTGLLDLLENDQQLLFVLAHEVGHVERRHTSSMFRAMKLGHELGGELGATISQVAFAQIEVNYGRIKELEADRFGYRLGRELRVPGRAAIRTFELLEASARHPDDPAAARQAKHEPAAPPAGPAAKIAALIEGHFRSHPPARERIDQIERLEREDG